VITKKVIMTDYDELEALFLEHFDIKYEILAEEEMGSSQWHAFTQVVVESKWSDFEKYKNMQEMMNELSKRGIIEDGTYMVEVYW